MSTITVFIPAHPPPAPTISALADRAVLSLASPMSRRAYSAALRRYLASGRPLNRDGVQAYMAGLRDAGAGTSTQNIALAAIRLLANEANVRGLLSDADMAAIERVRTIKIMGARVGNWLEVAGVKALLRAAGETQHGVRNAALVACMVGCGLRRSEVVGLTWEQWQEREGRWCWVDVKGKGGRVRTVPVPAWVVEYVEEWRTHESGLEIPNCGQ